MLNEFKKFALRGNMVDLAVGVILGAAFGKIVSSLVDDVIMPPLGLVLGKVDFNNLFVDLSGQGFKTLADAKAAAAPTLNYGAFITVTLNFLIVAFAVFLMVKAFNRLTEARAKDEPAATPTTHACPFCLSEIPIAAKKCPHCTSELQPAS